MNRRNSLDLKSLDYIKHHPRSVARCCLVFMTEQREKTLQSRKLQQNRNPASGKPNNPNTFSSQCFGLLSASRDCGCDSGCDGHDDGDGDGRPHFHFRIQSHSPAALGDIPAAAAVAAPPYAFCACAPARSLQ